MDQVRARLQELITESGNSYAGISSLLGRNSAYIQQFITRGTPRKLSEEDCRILAHYFRVSEESLGGQKPLSQPNENVGPLITIPILYSHVAAGEPGSSHPNTGKSSVRLEAQWLEKLGLRQGRTSFSYVEGDSMAPTLYDGDEIIIDHDDGAARLRNGIYVFTVDQSLVIKRVSAGPIRGKLVISSDNPAYPVWVNIEAESLNVLGRVVWMGRELPRRL